MASLPGWNSIETTGFLHDFFELGGIILFLIVVGFELLAYFYGHRERDLLASAQTVAATQAKNEQGALKDQLSIANTKVADLERQSAKRGFAPEQRETIVRALAAFKGQVVHIEMPMNDSEAGQYGNKFEELFKEAGWEPGSIFAAWNPAPVGVAVTINRGQINTLPPGIATLCNLLRELGIVAANRFFANDTVPVGIVKITVGVKP